MSLPRLHVVTNDDVLTAPGFRDRAAALIDAHGSALALHLRSPAGPARRLFEEAGALVGKAADAGTLLVVNDHADVALAVGAPGVQLGRRSIPIQAVRSLLEDGVVIGYSAHAAAEAASASAAGADFVFIGTIWETASHPGRTGAGIGRVREAVASGAPVLAIGGVTPERAGRAVTAGAWGVAVLRGVWDAPDPVAAAGEYLEELSVESP